MNNLEKEKYFAALTREGYPVYYTKKLYERATREQKVWIAYILPRYRYEMFPTIYEYRFDKIVGRTNLIEPNDEEKSKVVWCYRKCNTRYKVPVLIGGRDRATTKLTILIRKNRDGELMLVDSYFGDKVLPLPGNPEAKKHGIKSLIKSINFWNSHALVLPKEDIDVERTIKTLEGERREHFIRLME